MTWMQYKLKFFFTLGRGWNTFNKWDRLICFVGLTNNKNNDFCALVFTSDTLQQAWDFEWLYIYSSKALPRLWSSLLELPIRNAECLSLEMTYCMTSATLDNERMDDESVSVPVMVESMWQLVWTPRWLHPWSNAILGVSVRLSWVRWTLDQ